MTWLDDVVRACIRRNTIGKIQTANLSSREERVTAKTKSWPTACWFLATKCLGHNTSSRQLDHFKMRCAEWGRHKTRARAVCAVRARCVRCASGVCGARAVCAVRARCVRCASVNPPPRAHVVQDVDAVPLGLEQRDGLGELGNQRKYVAGILQRERKIQTAATWIKQQRGKKSVRGFRPRAS